MDFISRIILLLATGFSPTVLGLECGYPGSPLHGRPDTVLDRYSVGQVVTYSCDMGYFLMGPATRICLTNGTWTARLPICDTSLNPAGAAEISQSLARYSAMLAIDRKPDTCTFTTAHSPRWWRLDMGHSYRVLSVGLTMPLTTVEQRFSVYILGLSGTSAVYQRCAAFNGKLASPTLFLVCGEGTGITGRYIHIEDHRTDSVYFGLCEVDVMILKDHYDCGLPDRPARSYSMRLKPDYVEYKCVSGYKLMGLKQRQCLTNGQWSHSQPLCIEVHCEKLDDFPNGRIKISPQKDGQSLLDSVATYTCDEGHVIEGNDTRLCTESGYWSGIAPSCNPVDCGEVPHRWYSLLNESTGYNSLAELNCQDGQQLIGESPIIRCRGDASWSRAKAKCVLPAATSIKHLASQDAEESRQDDPTVSIGLIIGMVGALTVVAVAIAYVLFTRRRKKADSTQRGDTLSSSAAGSCQSLMANGYHENCFTRPKFANGVGDLFSNSKASSRVSAPTYGFSVIPLETAPHSPNSSESSRENIYEEITIGSTRRKTLPSTLEGVEPISEIVSTNSGFECDPNRRTQQPVVDIYAQVDFKKKRESRLMRDEDTSQSERLTPPGTPVVLRELPPIPSTDDDAVLHRLSTSSEATVIVENDIYEAAPIVEERPSSDDSVVVDNELYSSN